MRHYAIPENFVTLTRNTYGGMTYMLGLRWF